MENMIIKAPVSFDDIMKLDIRVCEIKTVEAVEKSDKLYKLTVNNGTEDIVVVSGLAKHYTKEDLIGKKIPFILNLPSRDIMGIESKGMIVAAEGQEKKLFVLECESPAGSVVF